MKKTIRIVLIILVIAGLFAAWKLFGPSVSPPQEKFLFVRTGSSF